MNLQIAQPTPQRVALSFRLNVRESDHKKLIASTFGSRTSFDATVEFEPNDFSNDTERLAACDLASVLATEVLRAQGTSRIEDRRKPGYLDLTVPYPYTEEDVRLGAQAMVREAACQKAEVVSNLAMFEAWSGQVVANAERIAVDSAKACERWIKLVDDFDAQLQNAITAGDEQRLLELKETYLRIAAEFPSLHQTLEEFSMKLSQTSPTDLDVRWGVHFGFGVMDMQENAFERTVTPGTFTRVRIDLSIRRAHVGPRADGVLLLLEFIAGGSLIAKVKVRKEVHLQAFDPVWRLAKRLGAIERFEPKDELPPIMEDALAKAAKVRMNREMSAWIEQHGSAHLKQGVALSYSMVRLYREERSRQVLNSLSPAFAEWSVAVDGEATERKDFSLKASPSAEAFEALVLVHSVAPGAKIVYGGNSQFTAVNDEVIVVPEGELFPNSSETFVYREAAGKRAVPAKRKQGGSR